MTIQTANPTKISLKSHLGAKFLPKKFINMDFVFKVAVTYERDGRPR